LPFLKDKNLIGINIIYLKKTLTLINFLSYGPRDFKLPSTWFFKIIY